MTLSKEALDLMGAFETFLAFLRRNGSTQTDRDMARLYVHALKKQLVTEDKPLHDQTLRHAA